MIISVPDCDQCSTFGLTYLPWLASSAPARPAAAPAMTKQASW